MTRYKGMVSGLIERTLAMLPHATWELRDSGQTFKSDLNELSQDHREYRDGRGLEPGNEELVMDSPEVRETLDNLCDSQRRLNQDRCEITRDHSEYSAR